MKVPIIQWSFPDGDKKLGELDAGPTRGANYLPSKGDYIRFQGLEPGLSFGGKVSHLRREYDARGRLIKLEIILLT
jgi:hypothetical protein